MTRHDMSGGLGWKRIVDIRIEVWPQHVRRYLPPGFFTDENDPLCRNAVA